MGIQRMWVRAGVEVGVDGVPSELTLPAHALHRVKRVWCAVESARRGARALGEQVV
jgi:hypothetical protein